MKLAVYHELRGEHTVGVLSKWKWASLRDSPWLPWGFERPKRRSLRKSLAMSAWSRATASSLNTLFSVPEGKGDVLEAVRVRDTSDTVLAPAKGARSCHVVREI